MEDDDCRSARHSVLFDQLCARAERWARGMLRLEPVPTSAVEYAVALPNDPAPEPYFRVSVEAVPFYCAAVGRRIRRAVEEQGLTGVRVMLTQIEAHPVDSSSLAYEIAAFQAVCAAIEAHGVPVIG